MTVSSILRGDGKWLLAIALWLPSAAFAEPITLVPGQKLLFLDDDVVQEMSGLTRTMHQLTKKGPVVRPDVPSDGGRLESYSMPLWDEHEKVYKLIYVALPVEESSVIMEKYRGGELGMAMAISQDGLNWGKPDLGQGISFRGSTSNNRIFAIDRTFPWGKNWIQNVIYDSADPDATRRYKGLLGATERCPIVSPDGLAWRKIDVTPIPSADTSSLMHDRSKNRYVAFVKTGNRFGRAVAMSISKDFADWSPPQLCFGADEEDQKTAIDKIRKRMADPGLQHPLWVDPDPDTGWTPPKGEVHHPTWRAECYQMAPFSYENVYLAVASMYYPTGMELYPYRTNTDGFGGTQLVMSRDLQNWTRLGNREEFIPPSRIDNGLVGVFDRGQIFAPEPIRMGDELWFYYTGYKSRQPLHSLNVDGAIRHPDSLTPEEKADVKDGWAAICLGTLRLDGFVSLDAARSGYVQTKPLKVAGDIPYLNVAAAKGKVQVEVLDESGKVISGFSREACTVIDTDGVRQQISWQGGSEFEYLVGRTVMFKIYLENAQLYAFGTDFPRREK